MADENQAAPDAGEAEYRRELEARVRGAVQDMGISTEEKPAEPEEPTTDEAEDGPEDEEEADTDPDLAEDEDEEADEEPEEEEKGKYSKAFRKLQKQEAELQEFKTRVLAQERDLKTREEKIQRDEGELVAFVKGLRSDTWNTLMRSGLITPKDAGYIAKQLYYHSEEAQSDPKNKAEAERIRREREFYLEAEENRNRIARLERERAEEREQAQRDAVLNAYVERINSTVDAYKIKTPVLAKALERNPERTNRELLEVANELSLAKGDYADPALVVLAWTKQRKALLAELGMAADSAPKSEQVKSKSAVEKKGPPNEKIAKPAQPDADPEAAYRRELQARLNGTWEGD